jgi:hypothetical protein
MLLESVFRLVKVRIVNIGSQKISCNLMKNKLPMKSKKIGNITEFPKICDSRNTGEIACLM